MGSSRSLRGLLVLPLLGAALLLTSSPTAAEGTAAVVLYPHRDGTLDREAPAAPDDALVTFGPLAASERRWVSAPQAQEAILRGPASIQVTLAAEVGALRGLWALLDDDGVPVAQAQAEGLLDPSGRDVVLTFPALDWTVRPGHRLGLTLGAATAADPGLLGLDLDLGGQDAALPQGVVEVDLRPLLGRLAGLGLDTSALPIVGPEVDEVAHTTVDVADVEETTGLLGLLGRVVDALPLPGLRLAPDTAPLEDLVGGLRGDILATMLYDTAAHPAALQLTRTVPAPPATQAAPAPPPADDDGTTAATGDDPPPAGSTAPPPTEQPLGDDGPDGGLALVALTGAGAATVGTLGLALRRRGALG